MKLIKIILILKSERVFLDYVKSSNLLRGSNKFWIEVMNSYLDCLRF